MGKELPGGWGVSEPSVVKLAYALPRSEVARRLTQVHALARTHSRTRMRPGLERLSLRAWHL